MNPLKIRGASYGRFPAFDVEIPAGTVAIVGANGAGKSRLLNAIELALFARDNGELSRWVSPFSDRGELELTFEHAGATYRVRRSFGKKATLDFERWEEEP